MEATRLLIAAVPAWLVTLALFHLMHSLIHVEWFPPPVPAPSEGLDRVRLVLPPPRRTTPPVPRRIVPPAPPPSSPSPPIGEGQDGSGVVFAVPRGQDALAARGTREHGIAGLAADSDAIVLIRVEPRYPPRALQQRREGRVLVEFTIGPTGAVLHPRVIRAEPAGAFEDAALTAVSQWRYSPRIVHGRAVSQPGIRTTIRFRLDQARS
ncbi:MAG: energy transducer TonB [Myxococcota bacterium]